MAPSPSQNPACSPPHEKCRCRSASLPGFKTAELSREHSSLCRQPGDDLPGPTGQRWGLWSNSSQAWRAPPRLPVCTLEVEGFRGAPTMDSLAARLALSQLQAGREEFAVSSHCGGRPGRDCQRVQKGRRSWQPSS